MFEGRFLNDDIVLNQFHWKDGNYWKHFALNFENAQMLPDIFVFSEEEVYDKIFRYAKQEGGLYVAIRDRNEFQSGGLYTLIGGVIANQLEESVLKVSFVLSKEYEGKGIMETVLPEFIRIAAEAGYHKLCFEIDARLVNHIDLMRKLGHTPVEKRDAQLIYVINLPE